MSEPIETVEVSRVEWDDMQRHLAEVRADVASLREALASSSGDGGEPPGTARSEPRAHEPDGRVGRRRALGTIAAAAAGVAAGAVAGAKPAAADNGDALILGNESQAATAGTAFAVNLASTAVEKVGTPPSTRDWG